MLCFWVSTVTPSIPNTTKGYSTRRNTQCILHLVPEHELIYHRRKYRLQAREVNNHVEFENLYDIRISSIDSSPLTQITALWSTYAYKPFDFSNIACYTHDMPSSTKKSQYSMMIMVLVQESTGMLSWNTH
jgi:hypothetical protein